MFLLPFHVAGISHEDNAPEVVGRLRLSAGRLDEALRALRGQGVPAVLLSTCHRTEVYWWGEAELADWFARTVLTDAPAVDGAVRFAQSDADLAVRHLFSVASGMKSVRFGEPEILGQLRRAWAAAREAGTSCGDLDGTFRYAIEAARHVRAAMGHEANASLGARVLDRMSAALGAPREVGLALRHLLVVGSGDAARGALQALRAQPIPDVQVHVTSRTDSRAAALAAEFGCPVVPWEQREQALREADAVVFAVHVTTPLVAPAFADTLPPRTQPSVWVDLGVPGAVHPAFASPQVHLIPLDEIDDATDPERESAPWRASDAARRRRAAAALQIELARYARATHRHQLGARLGSLEEQAVAVATSFRDAPVDELARRVTRLVLREFSRA